MNILGNICFLAESQTKIWHCHSQALVSLAWYKSWKEREMAGLGWSKISQIRTRNTCNVAATHKSTRLNFLDGCRPE